MSHKQKTVLIVDDDEGMRDTLTAILKREYRVLRVSTGEAGQPDDMVGCLVFLCSDESRPLTGDILIREFPMRWRS